MRPRVLLAASAALLSAACSDLSLIEPPNDALFSGPSFAIVDAGNEGVVPGFYFLPPLAKQVTVEGEFDPSYEPSMQVCLLNGNPSKFDPDPDPQLPWDEVTCVLDGSGAPVTVAEFAAGSADVSPDSHYQFSWNTEDDGTMDPDSFYRITVFLDTSPLGYLDVNPQRPSGESPGDDYDDLYAFRIGENLPVKFFLSVASRCAFSEDYVIQCTAQGVIDANGGVVTLEADQPGWSKLSTVVPPGALPAGYPTIVLTMERIDPLLFFAATGQYCIPGGATPVSPTYDDEEDFDAPQFGDCLRITTDPVLPDTLEAAAIIEMCINPFGLTLQTGQENALQIIRFGDDGETQGLPNVDASTCGGPSLPSPDQLGFFPIPDEGILRRAAILGNTVASWLAPEPVAAHGEIRLGGATSEFSRFRWALPGEMDPQPDSFRVQLFEGGPATHDLDVDVLVQDGGALDVGVQPQPLAGATVHFAANGGSIPAADAAVTTGVSGLAETTWTVPAVAGLYTLDATAFGLFGVPVPDHETLVPIGSEFVQISARIVGFPDGSIQAPPPNPPLSGLPGETLSDFPLVIYVTDENGQPVVGWDVVWTTSCSAPDPADCDGYVTPIGSETDADGMASGIWTLATIPGDNTATATVAGQTFTFVAGTWNAVGICQVEVTGVIEPGEWDCAEAAGDTAHFVANISGGDAPAAVYWQNTADSIFFLVKVQQSSLDKTNSLRIDFDNTLDGASADDDAIGYDAESGFFDEYLTQKCVNRSQSGCGDVDTVEQDGAGMLGNDGTYTIYELSHPLAGTAGEDLVVTTGDSLGFYLTLRIGKGAQGNTQFPGFRDFLEVVVR